MEKLPKRRRERIEVLYKGEKAFRDTSGYNLLYSKTAIGSGGFWGKGYKQGSVTQGEIRSWTRNRLISVLWEKDGLLRKFSFVLFYAIYIGRIFYLAETQKNTFNELFGYRLCWNITHALFHQFRNGNGTISYCGNSTTLFQLWREFSFSFLYYDRYFL